MLLATPPGTVSGRASGIVDALGEPCAQRMRWVYLLALVPSVTEWLVSGTLPASPRDAITDIALTLLLLVAARVICRQADRLDALAQTDALTGLWNRRRFLQDLPREVERAHRMSTALCLAYADVDGFKGINDRLGHDAGDAVLARLGRLLSATMRRHVDAAYRLGGDEFALLLSGSHLESARTGLERLCEAARDEASLSIGVVELRERETADELVRRADELMYEAKSKGRGRVEA